MYHIECIDIRPGYELFGFSDNACLYANNMPNTANIYIRNLMTGLKKPVPERTDSERSVIEEVNGFIPGINRLLKEKYEARVKKALERVLEGEELDKKLASIKHV